MLNSDFNWLIEIKHIFHKKLNSSTTFEFTISLWQIILQKTLCFYKRRLKFSYCELLLYMQRWNIKVNKNIIVLNLRLLPIYIEAYLTCPSLQRASNKISSIIHNDFLLHSLNSPLILRSSLYVVNWIAPWETC